MSNKPDDDVKEITFTITELVAFCEEWLSVMSMAQQTILEGVRKEDSLNQIYKIIAIKQIVESYAETHEGTEEP